MNNLPWHHNIMVASLPGRGASIWIETSDAADDMPQKGGFTLERWKDGKMERVRSSLGRFFVPLVICAICAICAIRYQSYLSSTATNNTEDIIRYMFKQ